MKQNKIFFFDNFKINTYINAIYFLSLTLAIYVSLINIITFLSSDSG